MNTYKHQITWLAIRFGVSALVLASTLGFTACGKKNNGGSQAQYNPLINPANQCSGGNCYGAYSGSQITKTLGRLQYSDNVDEVHSNVNNRLMELSLTINVLQTGNSGNIGSGYMNPYNPVPSSLVGHDLLYRYQGNVQVSGNLQVFSQIASCNVPVGIYNLQPISVGSIAAGHLWQQSVIATSANGQITLDLDGVQIIGMQATSVVNNVPVTFDSFLQGDVSIRECNNASFKME